jgi:insertion element IS1 protein InsB
LTIQCDELWSFVDNKGNKQWVWLALDVDKARNCWCLSWRSVGYAERNRNEKAARKLWESLPPVYRQCAVTYTDSWSTYGAVFPSQRYQAVGKAKQRGLGDFPHERLFQEETGLTSYIERFNNTLRQRVSRLVRKTLPFSKSLENQIGAIWYFVHYYNSSLLV